MQEIWRPVVNWENLYEVSNTGKVRSIKKGRIAPAGVLKGSDNGSGYVKIHLKNGERVENRYVHRIVAESFLKKPEGANVVNHKDFNPKNNCVTNLEWTTMKGNSQYSLNHGRFDRTETWKRRLKRSLDSKMGKPIIGFDIRSGKTYHYRALNDCKRDGFQPSCVSCCCNGKRKQHKGVTWEFGSVEGWNAQADKGSGDPA